MTMVKDAGKAEDGALVVSDETLRRIVRTLEVANGEDRAVQRSRPPAPRQEPYGYD